MNNSKSSLLVEIYYGRLISGIKHYRIYFLSDVILLEFKIMLKKRYGRAK